jgi:ABC-type Fe3+-siderophore transport system permease subunit
LSCAVLQRLILLGGPTLPLSTRTDFRSRLDLGVTIVALATCIRRAATSASLFATFFEGLLIQRAHPLSASYGNCSIFSFILSILWRTFSPLGTLFLSVFVIYVFAVFTHIHCAHSQSRHAHLVFLGGSYRESLGERTGNLLFCFLVCLYMWRARHSQLLSATRTQFWMHLTFIADT